MDDYVVHINPDLEKTLETDAGLLDFAHQAADQIAEIARDSAPVKSGAYKAGIKSQKTKRGARVFASDFKSTWIEFGNPPQNQPARFIIRLAAEQAGFKFRKNG